MAGLLDSLNNPWLAMGAGLLSASGPSTNPADVGLGRGLQAGLGNLSAMENARFKRELLENKLAMEKEQQRRMAEEYQAKQQQELQRQQALQQLPGLLNLPPEKQPELKGLMDAGATLPQALGIIQPKQEEKWSEPFVDRSTGKPILAQRNLVTGALKAVGSGGVNIQVGGGSSEIAPSMRVPTPEEAKLLGVDPDRREEYLLRKDGQLVNNPAAQDKSKLRETKTKFDNVETTLNSYADLIAKHGTEFWPGKAKAEIDTERTQLLLELKELYNLGALQAPDMALMEKILSDPTSVLANVAGVASFGRNAENYKAQLESIRAKLNAARTNAGLPVPPPAGFVEER